MMVCPNKMAVSYTPLESTQTLTPIFSDEEITQMVKKYGTPIFIVDEATLLNKLDVLQKAYAGFEGSVKIAYSMKANFNPSVLRVFMSQGILFDVTSLGELTFLLRSGGNPLDIIYTSVTEEKDEFEKVLERGVRRVVVGSYSGLEHLIIAVRELDVRVKVAVRINPEVMVKAVVKAAHRNGKFGVPLSEGRLDGAPHLLNTILMEPRLSFEGFHFHLGSQIEDASCFINALDKLEHFILKAKKMHPDLSVSLIDIGGGTPVFYGTPVPSAEEIGRVVSSRLNSMMSRIGERFNLIVESGRFLSSESGVLVSRIVNTKTYAGQKIVFVDAGFHLLLDAALLHQAYPQYVIPRSSGNGSLKTVLAGRLCDSYDIFPVSQISNLNGAEQGSLVIFQNVGAYSIVFGMPFHCQPKPPIFMRRSNGRYELIRRGQSIDDLFEDEGGYLQIDFNQ